MYTGRLNDAFTSATLTSSWWTCKSCPLYSDSERHGCCLLLPWGKHLFGIKSYLLLVTACTDAGLAVNDNLGPSVDVTCCDSQLWNQSQLLQPTHRPHTF